MEEIASIAGDFGLPPMTLILTVIALVTVGIIQSIRMIVTKYVKGRWTQRIPGWFWFALSIIIPIGVAYAFRLSIVQAAVNTAFPGEDIKTQLSSGAVMSGITAGLGSKGAYSIGKRLGLMGDYKPGGPADVTGPLPEVSAVKAPVFPVEETMPKEETVPNLGTVQPDLGIESKKPTVKIFMEIKTPSRPGYYALVEEEGRQQIVPILPVEDNERSKSSV